MQVHCGNCQIINLKLAKKTCASQHSNNEGLKKSIMKKNLQGYKWWKQLFIMYLQFPGNYLEW